ncbi:MAG: NHL repeat-containing protein [Armatimonadota bacterium]
MERRRFDYLELDDGSAAPTERKPRAAASLRPVEIIGGPGGRLGELNRPLGVAVDGYGNIYVADTANHRVQRVTPGGEVFAFSGYGHDIGALDSPADLVVDGQLNVYVVETGNCRVTKFSPRGEALVAFGRPGRGPGELDGPCAIARDRHGVLYVSDTGTARVQKFDARGRFIAVLADTHTSGLAAPRGLALDAALNVFVADDGRDCVMVLSHEGGRIGTIGEPGSEPGRLSGPRGLAILPDAVLMVSEERNCRVQGLTFAGESVCEFCGSGKSLALRAPAGLALDTQTGDIYLADAGSHCVIRFRYVSERGAGARGEETGA